MPVSGSHKMSMKAKKSSTSRSQKDVTNEEIHALLAKLKEIVPNMPRNRRLSKLEIIQYVMDYIVDLQIALESHPVAARGVNPQSGRPRQPLGVIDSPSNLTTNSCPAVELNHVEKSASSPIVINSVSS